MLSMLQWLCEQLMDVEVTAKINAHKSELTVERKGYRSGYRVRRFDTRMGTMYYLFQSFKEDIYLSLCQRNQCRKRRLINVIQEAYINGVSTSKIKRLTASLGIESISRGQVTNITRELNVQVQAFRNRRLEKVYPVLWVRIVRKD